MKQKLYSEGASLCSLFQGALFSGVRKGLGLYVRKGRSGASAFLAQRAREALVNYLDIQSLEQRACLFVIEKMPARMQRQAQLFQIGE